MVSFAYNTFTESTNHHHSRLIYQWEVKCCERHTNPRGSAYSPLQHAIIGNKQLICHHILHSRIHMMSHTHDQKN